MKPLRRPQASRVHGSNDFDSNNKTTFVTTEESGFPAMRGLEQVRSDDELLPEDEEPSRGQRIWRKMKRNRSEIENGDTRHQDPELTEGDTEGGDHVVYKVYKRRWFGMIQLALLNIIVSWDVSHSC